MYLDFLIFGRNFQLETKTSNYPFLWLNRVRIKRIRLQLKISKTTLDEDEKGSKIYCWDNIPLPKPLWTRMRKGRRSIAGTIFPKTMRAEAPFAGKLSYYLSHVCGKILFSVVCVILFGYVALAKAGRTGPPFSVYGLHGY